MLLWSLLLSMLLLCAQGVSAKLHVHSLDHAHDGYLDHTHTPDEASDHAHLSKAHYAHDTSHEHHDDVISEVDVSPDGALKNASNPVFSIALIVFLFTLGMLIPLRQWSLLHRGSRLIPYKHNYLLSPPLRAPPQH